MHRDRIKYNSFDTYLGTKCLPLSSRVLDGVRPLFGSQESADSNLEMQPALQHFLQAIAYNECFVKRKHEPQSLARAM